MHRWTLLLPLVLALAVVVDSRAQEAPPPQASELRIESPVLVLYRCRMENHGGDYFPNDNPEIWLQPEGEKARCWCWGGNGEGECTCPHIAVARYRMRVTMARPPLREVNPPHVVTPGVDARVQLFQVTATADAIAGDEGVNLGPETVREVTAQLDRVLGEGAGAGRFASLANGWLPAAPAKWDGGCRAFVFTRGPRHFGRFVPRVRAAVPETKLWISLEVPVECEPYTAAAQFAR